ncbi:hypothetical protein HAP47_0017030 [Bradyrhizobium sp. 41S5]|uniref:hypothetical protein n=1 Tax=Bradyrhizobium sp. 41S5 TaxID=1404443 RepID=UPI001E48926C|nr:hypothetical protein [Bradyrhizobium sp. 41S5]UFX49321.1 hypothetical protein HAP47_0017030 [Bradyrhizobium sp. 41S5]
MESRATSVSRNTRLSGKMGLKALAAASRKAANSTPAKTMRRLEIVCQTRRTATHVASRARNAASLVNRERAGPFVFEHMLAELLLLRMHIVHRSVNSPDGKFRELYLALSANAVAAKVRMAAAAVTPMAMLGRIRICVANRAPGGSCDGFLRRRSAIAA